MAGKDTRVGASRVAEENVIVERRRDPLSPAGGKKGGRGQSKSRNAIASLDGRACILEEAMGDVKDRLGMVEQNLQTLEDHVLGELELLKKALTNQDELHTRFMELFANVQEQLDVVKVGMEETRQETAMCKKTIAGRAVVTPSPRVTRQNQRNLVASEMRRSLTTSYGIWSATSNVLASRMKRPSDERAVLALPDHTKVFKVQKDACDFAIGGVLMQKGHPIAFESRRLNDTERSANQTDWARLLDVAQFLYNLMRSEATNQSPSEISIGQHSLTPLALAGDYKGRSPLAMQVARSWNEQVDMARSYLNKAVCKMNKWADKRQRWISITLGSW
ncbi:hypothetical protein RJ639_023741 [Escallonia herrerae]|uniref:Reverse transcriptase/retrotransposon-derived protein RNase H-like domain-containing protein n=1 Tax=Escallonia herrerae TaxID=1293975 RepID=A0AA88V1A0_9ASTE|nr:hypothetical protein RJ639_023741 [Escallonia herrerae]